MPAPEANTNHLQHGHRATYPGAENVANRIESGDIETDYRYGIPALPKPCTEAHRQALRFRRDVVSVVSAVHGESAVWIDERTVAKGRRTGQTKLVRRIAMPFAKLIQSATLAFRSQYAAGILSRLALDKDDLEAFGKWQDREARFADVCDRKLDALGVRKLLEPENDFWSPLRRQQGPPRGRDDAQAVASRAVTTKGDQNTATADDAADDAREAQNEEAHG